MPDEDVKDAAPSAAGEQAEDQQNAEATAVTGEQGADRPLQNTVAEFNRKFGTLMEQQKKQQEQQEAILKWIASQAVTQQAQQPSRQAADVQKPLTDEDLWALAQQGDRQAFEMYQQRIAERTYQTNNTQQRKAAMVQNQLAALIGKYPVLNNPAHPLTQHVNAAYTLLVQAGYPAGQETLLEAAKTAIADRPDLVSEFYNSAPQARETARRSATQTAQAGVTGATHRQDPPQASGKTKPLTPDQRALAARMGIKDPAKAVQRFLQRQENGQSSLGGVRAFVNDEEI